MTVHLHENKAGSSASRFGVNCFALLALVFFVGCGSDPQPTAVDPPVPLTPEVITGSFTLQFPDRMTSVEIADNLYRGANNPVGFAFRFTTDPRSFDAFRASTPQPDSWTPLTSTDDAPDTSGRSLPDWFKTAFTKALRYRLPITGEHRLRITLIVADTTDPAAVTVYIEGSAALYPPWSLADITSGNVGSTRWMLDKFADRIDAQFPSWTTIINVRQLPAAHCDSWLKLSIPSDSLKQFIESSPFAGGRLSDNERFCADDPDMPWWDPDKSSRFLSARLLTGRIFNTSILIDLDEQDFATVYIHCVETNAP